MPFEREISFPIEQLRVRQSTTSDSGARLGTRGAGAYRPARGSQEERVTHTRVELKIDVFETPGSPPPATIGATLHLPESVDRAPLLVCLPGATYSRRYFDLPESGYSDAEYHLTRGTIVLAVDHLVVGGSTIPPPAPARIPAVA